MRTFGIIFWLLFCINLKAQQLPVDSSHIYMPPEEGFTNKAEAKNIMKDSLKEGKWIENIDIQGNVTPYNNALYYRLTIYKDGKPYGIQRYYYYKSDKLAAVMLYENGEKNGVGKLYYASGQLLEQIPYKNGKKNGVSKLYYESGALENEIPYTEGEKNGLGKLYYQDGTLESETYYKNDLKNGAVKEYSDGGRLKSEAEYKNDTIIGNIKQYNDNEYKIK